VKLRVREDLHQLIRLDSVASIQNDGLVGNKFVQVESGTDQSPEVPSGGTIQSQEPFDLAEMFQRMREAIDLITSTITEVKVGLEDALTAVSTTATDAQVLIEDIGTEVRAITTASQKVAADLQVIVAGVRQGRGSIGKLVTDDAFYDRVRGIATEAEQAIKTLREAGENARDAIGNLQNTKGPVQGVVANLQQSLAAARETLTDLSATTEALKRNFFFRGFFNRRGFFDLDDMSVEAYRQGALQTGTRGVLRIWIDAAVLFEAAEGGRERLTEDGRRRLDSAMAAFVQYPPDTPFVVEGYADGITRDEQFVLSRSRAQLVRDYLVPKYGLDPGYVGTMPLGPEAPGSPANDRWNGVALAVFVEAKSR
jgi:phospholipid/cholesterol/gamma-HCH transport system substrate-binding protein